MRTIYGEAVSPANFAALSAIDWAAMWRGAFKSTN